MNKTRFKILYLNNNNKKKTNITKIRWNMKWRDTYDLTRSKSTCMACRSGQVS